MSLSPSFWGDCPLLRSAAIGRWVIAEGLAPRPKAEAQHKHWEDSVIGASRCARLVNQSRASRRK